MLAIEALVDRELGTHFGGTDPAEIARAFSELFAQDDAALRTRAADAWKRLYDARLPEIRLDGS